MKRFKERILLKHVQKRFHERYGIKYTYNEIRNLEKLCRVKNNYYFIGKETSVRVKLVLKYNDELIPIIYDKMKHRIVTVLTMNMLTESEKVKVKENIYGRF